MSVTYALVLLKRGSGQQSPEKLFFMITGQQRKAGHKASTAVALQRGEGFRHRRHQPPERTQDADGCGNQRKPRLFVWKLKYSYVTYQPCLSKFTYSAGCIYMFAPPPPICVGMFRAVFNVHKLRLTQVANRQAYGHTIGL